MQVVLLTHDSSDVVLGLVKRAVQSVDPEQPVEFVESLESMVHETLDPWRFALILLGLLAALATILTGLGLFAVISYMVRERTRELGIRLAIGSTRAGVLRLVVRQSLQLALLGILLGFAVTIAAARFLASLSYAIHPDDPAIFFTVAIFVVVISILAAYIPARRAAEIDPPLSALRDD